MAKNLPSKGERTKRNFAMADLRAIESSNDNNNEAVINGHAAVFSQVTNIGGWFNEVIEPGAFARTDFTDVVLSVNHDLDKIPLARSRNNNVNSTLQLQVDNIGLAVRANLDIENNNDAKSLYSSIGRGDMDGMSFIFYVAEDRWEGLDTDMPTRHIVDIAKVVEVSVVSFPAYDGTDIASRDADALESAKLVLENARSQTGLESSNGKPNKRSDMDCNNCSCCNCSRCCTTCTTSKCNSQLDDNNMRSDQCIELEKLRTQTLLKF
jgi:HK97 family phage prohead protease